MDTPHIDSERYIGIPYKHMGRDFHGVDCLGLLWLVLQDRGMLPLFEHARAMSGDTGVYPDDWDSNPDDRLQRAVSFLGSEVQPPYQPGDVMLFRGDGGSCQLATHMAIYCNGGLMLSMGYDAVVVVSYLQVKDRLIEAVRPGG